MSNVAPRGVPSLPWLSAFPELNVRTYVTRDQRPGVYFFSLEAGNPVAVYAARLLLNLPYYSASMRVWKDTERIRYQSRRRGDRGDRKGEFRATYAATGAETQAVAGTLEYFLTERYCLYHVDRRGGPYRLDIHHPPWRLRSATATLESHTIAGINGLSLPAAPELLHFVTRQDMVAWPPERLP